MNAWLLLAVVAVAAAAWEYYLVYLDSPGRRRVTAAQAGRGSVSASASTSPIPGNCSSPTATPSKPPQSGRGMTVTPLVAGLGRIGRPAR